ncbi:hypothetical protein FIU91_14535 [Roseivivax sp. THAF30]|nr:hypothetical protein FIU91_14535 [Roseivivax sp. THAF30]
MAGSERAAAESKNTVSEYRTITVFSSKCCRLWLRLSQCTEVSIRG